MTKELYLFIVLLSLCTMPSTIIAASRATDEKVDSIRDATNIDKLLDAPAANCNKVCSLFMTGRNPKLEEVIGKVMRRLAKEDVDAEGAAALAIIYARGERALGISMARQMRDSSYLQELPQALLPTLVNAYSGLPDTYDGKFLNELSREIVRLLTERGGKPGKNHRTLNKWDD